MAEIFVLKDGYAYMNEGHMFANSTCSLIRTPLNTIIVDTLTPWDGPFIKEKLKELGVDKVDYVVSTHGHPDHTGNNNLFLEAKQHIVGFCISCRDKFYIHPFEQGEDFIIDEYVVVTPTPGHTNEDVSLLVKTKDGKLVAVAGDLFESEADIENPILWTGNSFNAGIQVKNRLRILKIADDIIPGHGPKFPVKPKYIEAAEQLLKSYNDTDAINLVEAMQ